MINKRTARICVLLVLAGILLLALFSCADEPAPQWVDYDGERLSDYLSPVVYQGLRVTLTDASETRGAAIFRAVLSGAEVIEYPEEQVAYYAEQIRAEYRYLAEREDMSYEELLALRGITEQTIEVEAKEMVKRDLCLLYIQRDAAITLSEEERQAHYDRYARVYVEQYGYDRAYVDANLQEEIRDSMLFDKTMEYLILHNEVTNG